ncbi:MAG: short subunit dehydrogenase-like uncharacterized protein [Verrucomicrobiales bacterium]|jgi:short subunit dehydrogenase-like uncharacterized protein
MKPHPSGRTHDVVVFGASGFVGRLVVGQFLEKYPLGGNLRWAVAGRDRQKLETMLDELVREGERPPVIISESHDRESLHRLSRDTKVVLSTVGPYALYGSELVAACVANGTDYCDLSGEVEWVRKMIDWHQDEAQQSGARIVTQCGFDSIPSDIGVFFLQQQAIASFGHPCSEITMLVRSMRGGFSGGTMASLSNSIGSAKQDHESGRLLMDPYGLNPKGEREGPDGPNQSGSRFDRDTDQWTAPFIMAPINTKVVRRTNALLGYLYGRDFRYTEAMMTGEGFKGRCIGAMSSLGQRLFMMLVSSAFTRRLVIKLGPKPGEGPSRERRESGFFDILFVGKQPDGRTMRLRVKGDRDPGYAATSKMLAESAVCLAAEESDVQGGFWTPAAAMGDALRARLVANAGMSFEWEGTGTSIEPE